MVKEILIIDDFRISNEFVSSSLNANGYDVYSFQHGKEAINFLKNNKIDLIITDFYMPEMDGIEFIRELRRIPDYADTPVIFLSSTQKTEKINEAKKYNIVAWLKKPLNINNLINHISTL